MLGSRAQADTPRLRAGKMALPALQDRAADVPVHRDRQFLCYRHIAQLGAVDAGNSYTVGLHGEGPSRVLVGALPVPGRQHRQNEFSTLRLDRGRCIFLRQQLNGLVVGVPCSVEPPTQVNTLCRIRVGRIFLESLTASQQAVGSSAEDSEDGEKVSREFFFGDEVALIDNYELPAVAFEQGLDELGLNLEGRPRQATTARSLSPKRTRSRKESSPLRSKSRPEATSVTISASGCRSRSPASRECLRRNTTIKAQRVGLQWRRLNPFRHYLATCESGSPALKRTLL